MLLVQDGNTEDALSAHIQHRLRFALPLTKMEIVETVHSAFLHYNSISMSLHTP